MKINRSTDPARQSAGDANQAVYDVTEFHLDFNVLATFGLGPSDRVPEDMQAEIEAYTSCLEEAADALAKGLQIKIKVTTDGSESSHVGPELFLSAAITDVIQYRQRFGWRVNFGNLSIAAAKILDRL